MKNEITKKINELTERIHSAIECSSTKELTYGSNGYPEPYAGVLLRVDEIEELAAMEELKKFFQTKLKDINDLYEELPEDEKEEIEDVINDLNEVEVSFAQAEWRDGWTFANPSDMHSIDVMSREDDSNAFIVEDIGDCLKCQDVDDALDELGVLEEIKEIADRTEMSTMDVLESKEYGDLIPDGVVVEYGAEDERELEWFSCKAAAKEWLNEKVISCPYSEDTRNYAVGLRIFGFTSDLHDRLQAGGGICNVKGAAVAALNIPRYRR